MKSPLCNTTRENPNPNPYPGKHVDASKSPHPSTDGGSGQKRRKGIFRLWTLGTEPRTFWFCFDDQTARLWLYKLLAVMGRNMLMLAVLNE